MQPARLHQQVKEGVRRQAYKSSVQALADLRRTDLCVLLKWRSSNSRLTFGLSLCTVEDINRDKLLLSTKKKEKKRKNGHFED